MNASLCQAITGEPASQEVLEMLERRNLFVVPLDEQRQWYRLHSLFREVLLARIQATQPELVPYLHQRAARWYEKRGFLHEAMLHALAAKDFFFAASMMEHDASQFWMKGEAKTIACWVLLLPDDVFRTHMGFALTSTLHLLSSAQSTPEQQRALALVQSEQIITRVEHALQDQRETSFSQSEVKRLQSRIYMLRELVDMIDALRTGAMQQVRSLAQQMQPLVIHEPVVWKWFPLYGLFVSAQFLGDSVLLLPELLAMKQQAFQEQDRATASVVLCWIAAAYLYAGKLRLLQQECFHAQDLLEQAGKPVAVAAYPTFDLSFLYYERNQLEQAEASLQSAIHQASLWQDMNLLVWGNATRVKVFLASEKIEEAQEALQQAQLLMQQSGLSVYASEVIAAQVTLWLAQGNLSAAEAWTTHADLDPQAQDYVRQEEYVALARVYLAQQRYEQCLLLLVPLLNRMERVERHWDIIHLLALQVAALFGLEKIAQARQVAIRLLVLTEPEGYIRVYLDSGEPMRHVLLSLLDTPHHDGVMLSATYLSYISMLLTTFEQEKHRDVRPQAASGTESNQSASQIEAHPQEAPYEPLSPQERRVLSLLVAGQTYAEIAHELIVSPNTIKTQVSSIYRKLGVSRRAQASMLARQLHLL